MAKSIEKAYKEFLSNFGIKLSDEEIKRRVAIEPHIPNFIKIYKMTDSRERAINAYKMTCEDFGYPVSDKLPYLHESKIWNYVIRNVNTEVIKRFGKILNQIENIIKRKRIITTITALFDQRIYIDAQQVRKIIDVANDTEDLIDMYLSFGGVEEMLTLSSLTSETDEYEEDRDDDEYDDYEEVDE